MLKAILSLFLLISALKLVTQNGLLCPRQDIVEVCIPDDDANAEKSDISKSKIGQEDKLHPLHSSLILTLPEIEAVLDRHRLHIYKNYIEQPTTPPPNLS